MLLPWSWLQEWVAIDLTPEALADRLAFAGLEVDAIESRGGEWDHVVVGEIRSIEPHPNADRLVVCTVDTGEAEPRQIVCGATNMAAGDHVPVALPGARLGDLRVTKSKLRGVVSQGMMCSPRELGLGEDHNGLLILDADSRVGAPAGEALGGGDPTLELSITPNRGDCLSIRGLAREVAILAGRPLTPPDLTLSDTGPDVAGLTSVTLEDPEGCPRYACRVVEGIRVGPSPPWLADAVTVCGMRPINNIVDATNYVMMELGQPLHAFDLAALAEGRIVVRRARSGERITTLEGADCPLTDEMTVIADAEKPVALAGIMGGLETGVTEGTTALLLESAYFDPRRIRRTARTLKLASESSYRFERGTDIETVPIALDRLAQIIVQVAGGTVAAGRVDAYPAPMAPRVIRLRIGQIARVLGVGLAGAAVRTNLEALGCRVAGGEEALEVTVPTWRSDLTREIDLIEEVARLTGYEQIPVSLPAGARHVEATPSPWATVEDRIRDALTAAGLTEVLAHRLGPPDDAARLGFDPAAAARETVTLMNPLREDRAVLRTHLMPGLLRLAGANQRHGNGDLSLFELGPVFRRVEEDTVEPALVGGVFAGCRRLGGWSEGDRAADVYDAKGACERVLDTLGQPDVTWHEGDRPYFRPAAQAAAKVGDTVVAWVGELRAEVLEAFGAAGPMFGFVLNLKAVESRPAGEVGYSPFSRYPPVLRVRTYDVPEAVRAADLTATLVTAGGALVERVHLSDVYRGSHVETGKKSLTVALVYRAPDRTLTDEEVEQSLRRLDAAAGDAHRATVREA